MTETSDPKPTKVIKRRTIEEREAAAKAELAQLGELKKSQAKEKAQHALDTMATVPSNWLSTPECATATKALQAFMAAVK